MFRRRIFFVALTFFACCVFAEKLDIAGENLKDVAAKILHKRATSGDGDAILKVALAYATGEMGFPKDKELSLHWI